MGILIKGSNYLEALASTSTVVLDKTGTLTEGVFEVQKIYPVSISEEELLMFAAYAENFSTHPIAQSIKNAYGKEIENSLISNTEELTGRGIFSIISEKEVLIGNEKLMQERNINFEKCNDIGTVVYVAINNNYVGYILISDKIKEDSKKAITNLKQNGIKTIMLTGDKKDVGEDVARKIGLDEVYTELLPDGKVSIVEEFIQNKNSKEKIVFVGDGINDAPVLALADIGMAMGGLGSDAAIEAADIVIMTDEPSKVYEAIKLSKRTIRIVKENIIFALYFLFKCYIATFSDSLILSAIIAMNSEFVGFPLLELTVYPKIFSCISI